MRGGRPGYAGPRRRAAGSALRSAPVERWRVRLPPQVRPPFQVFLSGVPQKDGVDYEYRDGELLFDRPIE